MAYSQQPEHRKHNHAIRPAGSDVLRLTQHLRRLGKRPRLKHRDFAREDGEIAPRQQWTFIADTLSIHWTYTGKPTVRPKRTHYHAPYRRPKPSIVKLAKQLAS